MAKHKLKQTKQDLLGQYNTVNADRILENFTSLVERKRVIDPCAGSGDLLSWANKNGASWLVGYDIDPSLPFKVRDMYKDPADCSGSLVVTNPPYLSKNRSKDKEAFDRWGQNDLYKCYLATLMESNVSQAIIIMPSNFLCESRSKAREMLFENYDILYAEHWQEEIFPKVAIGIMVAHIKRGGGNQEFDYLNRTTGKTTRMNLKKEYGFLHGARFFEFLNRGRKLYRFEKVDKGMDAPNSNIIVSLLDKGTYGLGLAYNQGEPIYSNPKSFTTYQINTPFELDEAEQIEIVDLFNLLLDDYRELYDSMFLSNYIDYNQKILSRSYVNKLLSIIIEDYEQ